MKREESSEEYFSISEQGIKQLSEGISSGIVDPNWQWTTDIKYELPVRIRRSGLGSANPVNLLEMFEKTKNQVPFKVALKVKRNGVWIERNFSQFYEECRWFASALIHFGIQPYKAVNILGFNSPEWHIAFLGSIFGQYLPVGVYTTNGPEACQYVAEHSEAQVVVVENQEGVSKYMQTLGTLPELKLIVVYNDKVPDEFKAEKRVNIITYKELIEVGKGTFNDKELRRRANLIKPGNCCTLVYTSGTTGNPKGVMLSHDNYTWTADCMLQTVGRKFGQERIVSYLPLSHVAAQSLDIISCICVGAEIWFAGPDALQGTLVQTLLEARPTIFFGVPRVWEKIEEKMRAIGAANGFLKQKIGDWAKGKGVEGTFAEIHEKPLSMQFKLAKKLIFNKIKQNLGLDQCDFFCFGAAPMNVTTRLYFASLNIFLVNMYGMSECSGPQTYSDPRNMENFDPKTMVTAGIELNGTDIKIFEPDNEGNGEICYRGRNRFMGYYKDSKSTKETIDSEGFLHSGDVGKFDAKGNLFITGRIKELIITAGGENIPPILIESKIKDFMPFLSNVMIYGDNRKYLVALFTLKVDEGKDTLTADALKDLSSHGITDIKTISDALSSKALSSHITKQLSLANSHAISKAQHVKFWKLLPEDFSIPGGELTPTLKLKRKVAAKKWMAEIEKLYIEPKL